MPPVIALIVTAAVAIASVVSVETLITIGVSLVLSGLSSALTSKPGARTAMGDAQYRQITARQAAAPWRIIYGQHRIGGVFTFLHAAGVNNEFLYSVITLAGHQLADIGTMYFDGEIVPLDAGGDATGRFAGFVHVEKNLGTATQAAFTGLNADLPQLWTANHRQRGRAGVYIRFKWNPDLFPSGLPNITFDVKGKPVLDPRTGTTDWNDNPALNIADHLSSADYSYGADFNAEIDQTQLIASANVCDEFIPLRDGGSEKRYTVNGVFESTEEPGRVTEQMAGAMAGAVVFTSGKFWIYAGAWRPPTVSLDEDDIISPLKIRTKLSRRELFNGVKGTFVNPSQSWQQTDFPAVPGASYLAEDNNERLWKDIFLPFTVLPVACQRLGKIDLERARRQVTVEATFKLSGYQLQPPEVVQLTVARLGWTNKTFEVARSSLVVLEDAEGGPALAVEMSLREADANVYVWNTSDEDSGDPATGFIKPPGLDDLRKAPNVTNPTADVEQIIIDGQRLSKITIGYTAPDPLGSFYGIIIAVQNYLGDGTLVTWFEQNYVGNAGQPSSGKFTLESTEETVTLYFISKNRFGETVDDWTTAPSVQVVLGAAPPNVTAPAVTEDGVVVDGHHQSRLTFSWTNPIGENYGGVAIYMKGYLGDATYRRRWVKTKDFSTFREDLEKTGETVFFAFVSFDRNEAENRFAGSPGADDSISVVLDGNDSAPNAPAGFTCQAVAAKGQVVILTWSENIESDIDHYQIARRQDATAPGDADVVATVQAHGESATQKAQWEDAPGSATANYRYYVRAVDTAGNKSAFTGPCSIRALAPDGTKDISTPTQGMSPTGLYTLSWGAQAFGANSVPGAFQILFEASGVPAESFNMEGVYIHRFEVDSWADNDCLSDFQTRIFEFTFNPARSERMVMFWPNRYVKQVRAFLVNYFGLSPSINLITFSCGSLAFTGSEAEDAKPPTTNFDRAVQDYGARRVIGRSTGDLELDTNSASAKIRAIKKITTDVGYQVLGAAASGQFIRGNGTDGVFSAILAGDLPAVVVREDLANTYSASAQDFTSVQLLVKRFADLGSALSAANFPGAVKELGFVWDGTNFWLIYHDGSNKWKWQGTQVL